MPSTNPIREARINNRLEQIHRRLCQIADIEAKAAPFKGLGSNDEFDPERQRLIEETDRLPDERQGIAGSPKYHPTPWIAKALPPPDRPRTSPVAAAFSEPRFRRRSGDHQACAEAGPQADDDPRHRADLSLLSRQTLNPVLSSSATPTAMSAASPCARRDGRSDSVMVRQRCACLIVRAGCTGGMVVIVAAVP